ncbi:MAG: hypothetical protein ABSE90_10930, partial [Verrucomicrobiota bacterium]
SWDGSKMRMPLTCFIAGLLLVVLELFCFSLRDCRFIANADSGLLVRARCQTLTANFTGWHTCLSSPAFYCSLLSG